MCMSRCTCMRDASTRSSHLDIRCRHILASIWKNARSKFDRRCSYQLCNSGPEATLQGTLTP